MNVLEYYAHHFAYGFIILLCGMPLFILAATLRPFLPAGPVETIANLLGLCLVFIWLLGGSWLVNTASRKRVLEGEGFFEALGSAWAEACLYLSYLPAVGRLVRGRSLAPKNSDPPGPIRPQ